MKSSHPLVSCIVPVYNAEKYLDQGIKSLLTQTYGNLEILLVDDQSNDNSWNICKKYSEKYPNILAFRNNYNSGGPLRSRERGIKECHGEWVTFMDCDDYVKPKYIEHLLEATFKGKYDIAVTGHSKMYSDGRTEKFFWKSYYQTTEQRLCSFYHHFLTKNFWTDPTDTVGQNLIRTSICKKTDISKYSNLIYAEDTLMALAFLSNSKKGVNFVDKHDFIWRQVEGSGSHGGFSSRANQTEFLNACMDIFHRPDIYSVINRVSPLISIIIPVYNVEPYLAVCLKSIINQTYENLEIIIVNDGSTDKSQKIINEYKRKDHRIVALKQKNNGLNMARAAGSKLAKGEYIAFVDSDDIVHKDYIRDMYENLIENDVDISIIGYKDFVDEAEVNKFNVPRSASTKQVIKSNKESVKYYLGDIASVPNIHQMTAWGKLYRADLIKRTDWLFSNYGRHEDDFETLQWYSKVTKGIVATSAQLYYYRKNPKSITHKPQHNINPDGKSLNYFETIYELYEKKKSFLDDSSLDIAILNNLAHTNRAQVNNFFSNRQLDKDNIVEATNNWNKIIKEYNKQIQLRDQIITQQKRELDSTYNSISWRISKPLRIMRALLLKHK
jgi:glycosyltransferase involved in cell wall biosynthesis